MHIAPGVHRITTCYPDFENIPMAGYLLIGQDRVALVDATIPDSIERDLRPFLERLGLGLLQIDLVIVSHGHPDHVGGLAALKRANPALEILCSEGDQRWVENQDAMWQELFLRYPDHLSFDDEVRDYIVTTLGGEPTAATSTLKPGDVVDLGGMSLRAVDAAGHSPGHLALLESTNGLLFTGDAVQGSGISHVNTDACLPPLYEDYDAYVASLEGMTALAPEAVLSAHHDPQVGDAAARFLELSLSTAHRNHEIVTQLARADQATLTLPAVADQLRIEVERRDTARYVGALQFLAVADAHLRSIAGHKPPASAQSEDHPQ